MKDAVLATITSGESKTYVKAFDSLVSGKHPYLSNLDLMKFYPQKPIIGQVLDSCFGCKKVKTKNI